MERATGIESRHQSPAPTSFTADPKSDYELNANMTCPASSSAICPVSSSLSLDGSWGRHSVFNLGRDLSPGAASLLPFRPVANATAPTRNASVIDQPQAALERLMAESEVTPRVCPVYAKLHHAWNTCALAAVASIHIVGTKVGVEDRLAAAPDAVIRGSSSHPVCHATFHCKGRKHSWGDEAHVVRSVPWSQQHPACQRTMASVPIRLSVQE